METDDLDSEVSFKKHIKLHKDVLELQHNELEFSKQGILLNKMESKIENIIIPAPSAKSEVQPILKNLAVELEVRFEKTEEIKSVEIEESSSAAKNKKVRKNTDGRFYKPEHIQLLIQTYKNSARYPSKEKMSELAKLIGVLPIKIQWWFTDRRKMDRKNGEKFPKAAKNKTYSKIDDIVKNETQSNQAIQDENSATSENSAQSENSAKRENSAQSASGKVPCRLCGKQISKTSMKVHERVHTGEKPFSCTYCQMKFKQKIHVKVR